MQFKFYSNYNLITRVGYYKVVLTQRIDTAFILRVPLQL